MRSSGGAHTSGTDDHAPHTGDPTPTGTGEEEPELAAEIATPTDTGDMTPTDTGQEEPALPAEIPPPIDAENAAPQAPPDTPDNPLPVAATLTDPPLENDSDVERTARGLTADTDIPDTSINTSATYQQSRSGDTSQPRLFLAVQTAGPAADPADQHANALTTPQLPASIVPADLKATVTDCICNFLRQAVTVIGDVLGGIANPGGGAPQPESPVPWAVLGWVRRQVTQVLEIPPVARVFQVVKSVAAEQSQKIVTCGQPTTGLPAEFDRTVLVSGLTEPTDFRILPTEHPEDPVRILIVEKGGAIRLYENGQLNPQPVVVLPTLSDYSERGLAGIEVDPDFLENGYIYVSYTSVGNHDRLSRLTVTGSTADLASEQILLQSELEAGLLHHGGEILFGPDDMLYWAVGDNGVSTNAQELSNIHGKILRLNPYVLNPDGTATAPADNPFVSDQDAVPQIYAYGFRNPFRFTFTPNGKLLVADVGDAAWEELNVVTPGANYGWPNAEGVCENCGYVNPIYAYPHTPPPTTSGSITSVMVYTGDTFGESYQNKVFIADFSLGWIKELTFDSQFSSFINERTFDGQGGTTVKLAQGPDENIYQLTIYPGELSVVAPSGGNRAPTAVITATPSNLSSPLNVQFSSQNSSDPENSALTYAWDFGDGSTSIAANPMKTYTANGAYTVTLTVSDGDKTGQATQRIVVGSTPPQINTIEVVTPANNGYYNAGDTITFTASASDGDEPPLSPSAYEWTVVFHHAEHVHPFRSNIIGPSGSVEIPRSPHNVANTWYRVTLTVTDSSGLSTSRSVDVNPNLVTLTVNASDPSATFTIDGIPHQGSYTEQAVVGVERVLDAPSPQHVSDGQLVFNNWSDGQPQRHTIITPSSDASYTATYDKLPAVT